MAVTFTQIAFCLYADVGVYVFDVAPGIGPVHAGEVLRYHHWYVYPVGVQSHAPLELTVSNVPIACDPPGVTTGAIELNGAQGSETVKLHAAA
ncbi:MAG: hypothetical protein JWM86_582 [Thermoleophilia bacterium]|nr:hypothetical protein [Thermoleophilia bacterium]